MGTDGDWGTDPLSLTLPPFAGPNDPAIVIGQDIPQELRDLVHNRMGATMEVVSAIIYRFDNQTSMFTALTVETTLSQEPFALIQGTFGPTVADGSIDAYYIANQFFGIRKISIGQDINDQRVQLGQDSGSAARLVLAQVPFLSPSDGRLGAQNLWLDGYTAAGLIRARINGTERFRVNNTGAIITGTERVTELITADGGLTLPAISDPLTIDGISAPRGTRFVFGSQSDFGSTGTGGTQVNLGSMTFRAGRAYTVKFFGGCSTSTATGRMGIDITLSGGSSSRLWGDQWFGPQIGSQALPVYYEAPARNNTGADITANVLVLVVANAGTVNWLGSVNRPRGVIIEDCGAASQYANAALNIV